MSGAVLKARCPTDPEEFRKVMSQLRGFNGMVMWEDDIEDARVRRRNIVVGVVIAVVLAAVLIGYLVT